MRGRLTQSASSKAVDFRGSGAQKAALTAYDIVQHMVCGHNPLHIVKNNTFLPV